MKKSAKHVIVALSGGVDSAVAALRLLKDGYSVAGLHMTNWESGDEYCPAGQDFADARQVADDLGITLHHVNFTREYRERVFSDFLAEYRAGRTPNPDVACNRHIKFGEFLQHASRLGADLIATGHYASVRHEASAGRLFMARDAAKDQTYFLHAVDGHALARVLFPLGELTKPEVRSIAREHGLANHARRDSTGICFIGERPFREFIGQYIDPAPGNILTPEGDIVGRHDGLPGYTLGQRQGLGIGGLAGGPELPWYVAGKDLASNALLVVQGHDHPLLFSEGLTASGARWIAGEPPAAAKDGVLELGVSTRYRQPPVPCELRTGVGGELAVRFHAPQWAVTPGQYVVFYAGRECLGGAVIETRWPVQRIDSGARTATA